MSAQLLAQVFAQVAHIGKRLRALLPEPLPHLFYPELLLADGFKIPFQFRLAQMPDVLERRGYHAAKVS